MIKVTLQLENGLSSASPDGQLHFCLPPGSCVADLRRLALRQIGDHPGARTLREARLLFNGQALADKSPLPPDQAVIQSRLDIMD